MAKHICVGTALREKLIDGRIVKFDCQSCGKSFYPLPVIGESKVDWFAAEPNKAMIDAADSGDVAENLAKIDAANTPLYEKILFVRTDEDTAPDHE